MVHLQNLACCSRWLLPTPGQTQWTRTCYIVVTRKGLDTEPPPWSSTFRLPPNRLAIKREKGRILNPFAKSVVLKSLSDELKGITFHECTSISVLKESDLIDRTVSENRLKIDAKLSTPGPVDTLLCSGRDDVTEKGDDSVQKFPEGKPNWNQLQHIALKLSENLPYFFVRRQDFTFYRDDVVLENRITGVTIKGVQSLFYNFGVYRTIAHFRWSYVELQVLNISPMVEEATVRARMRIVTVNLVEALIIVVKYGGGKDNLRKYGRWHDLLGHYAVGDDGLVYHIVLDKVMPDDEYARSKPKSALSRLMALLRPAKTTTGMA